MSGTLENSQSAGASGTKIVRAVIDQFRNRHYALACDNDPVWVQLADINKFDNQLVERLGRHGIIAVTTTRKNEIKKQVESWDSFDEGLVATHPGYIADDIYICGDGEVLRIGGDEREVIVAFEPDIRFSPVGDLSGWQSELDLVIAGNATASFLLAFAFASLLLRFAPSSMHNPYIELVGPAECGKTSFAVLACSVFAGGRDQIGGADSWNVTAAGLNQVGEWYSDALQVLDEQNEQDSAVKVDSAQTFKGASGSRRRRFNELNPGPAFRMGTLSTSNDPFSGLGKPGTEIARAAATRRLAIIYNDKILQSAPNGFDTTAKAMSALREAIDRNHGVASRAFVREVIKIASADLSAWKDLIAEGIHEFEGSRVAAKLSSDRIRKVFGLVRVAGQLAREWRILPVAAMPIDDAIARIVPLVMRTDSTSSTDPAGEAAVNRLDDLIDHVRQYTTLFVKTEHGLRCRRIPMPRKGRAFSELSDGTEITEQDGHGTMYLRPVIVRDYFGPEHLSILRELRDNGRLRVERGKQPKLLVKAPVDSDLKGRVYAFLTQ
ncbi:DUF927 domain-containing protein [Aurantimonas sp. DM33-3]|uniref:DUF927 domain-containing protein n=1 Tax=Aurantimonas sp. DM33-3 TaxID=2766955 RepID=UPI001651BA00|nr:DUF927 domain-containing protein [Aurantimonas sp. DM33-3]MBC6718682.1 DUF927 domain-containing protein [Aurantimonas sp. DM33-3]